jgi:hypothetical protein
VRGEAEWEGVEIPKNVDSAVAATLLTRSWLSNFIEAASVVLDGDVGRSHIGVKVRRWNRARRIRN